ncbi:unnamed protein product [Sphenostylis stenocarpa]|uniref:Serine/threonine-protein kinase ATM n=1 Tax=Sphenostylis stenocarpa TaxID=92480 RepID=A0AA86SY19_9FABA|nr:unnamed protein product [Sphenostylis stenocarpa]
MAKVTSRDIQEIVEKLSSDKVKAREEGVKLLNTWLEGERSYNFCKFIALNTAKLRPDEIPHTETWPFLVSLLIKSASAEISSSKRRNPKMIYAKTLRIVVQRAEDAKCPGQLEELSSVVKLLFNHVWDVLSNVPSFQSEYGIILRHLLDESKISRKLVDCINTYLLNDGPNLGSQFLEIHNAMQQFVFRSWLTTHDRVLKDSLVFYARIQLSLTRGSADRCLLVEQLLDVICKDLDQGSTSSTSMLRGDGNKDDKLGALSSSQCGLVELAAVLFYRFPSLILLEWLGTLHSYVIGTIYVAENTCLIPCVRKLVEPAKVVAVQACLNTTRSSLSEKRLKRESAAVVLREALMEGKWLCITVAKSDMDLCCRNAAFCSLIRNFHSRICKDLFLYWFEGICTSFERIMNSSNVDRIYDGLLWTMRTSILKEFARTFFYSIASKFKDGDISSVIFYL